MTIESNWQSFHEEKTLSKQNEMFYAQHTCKKLRREKAERQKKTIVETYGAVVILKLYKKQNKHEKIHVLRPV